MQDTPNDPGLADIPIGVSAEVFQQEVESWDEACLELGSESFITPQINGYKSLGEVRYPKPFFLYKRLFPDVKAPEKPKHWTDSGSDVFAHNFKRAYIRGNSYPGQELLIEPDESGDLQGCAGGGILTLNPGERALIGTGLAMQVSIGYEVQVRPRSGNALKFGLTVLNTPGTIDSSYRGEVGVILVNNSLTAQTVKVGDPIAQVVVAPVALFPWTEAEELTDTLRGDAGYGSTGTVSS